MRLPVEPPLATEPAEDLYTIRRRGPVPAPIKAGPRSLPPVVTPAPSQRIPEQAPPVAEQPKPTREGVDWREGEDRRKVCRRIRNVPVLLDTRSGEDRRKSARREDDPVTGVDKEV